MARGFQTRLVAPAAVSDDYEEGFGCLGELHLPIRLYGYGLSFRFRGIYLFWLQTF
jgi:IS4 transposase